MRSPAGLAKIAAYRKSERFRASMRRYQKSDKGVASYRCRNERLKKEVLGHYGIDGIPACRWPGCKETDIDVLTLDHIENDGWKDRLAKGRHCGGKEMYYNAKKAGFPPNFQTLCMNHQLKKQILLQKEKRRAITNA